MSNGCKVSSPASQFAAEMKYMQWISIGKQVMVGHSTTLVFAVLTPVVCYPAGAATAGPPELRWRAAPDSSQPAADVPPCRAELPVEPGCQPPGGNARRGCSPAGRSGAPAHCPASAHRCCSVVTQHDICNTDMRVRGYLERLHSCSRSLETHCTHSDGDLFSCMKLRLNQTGE